MAVHCRHRGRGFFLKMAFYVSRQDRHASTRPAKSHGIPSVVRERRDFASWRSHVPRDKLGGFVAITEIPASAERYRILVARGNTFYVGLQAAMPRDAPERFEVLFSGAAPICCPPRSRRVFFRRKKRVDRGNVDHLTANADIDQANAADFAEVPKLCAAATDQMLAGIGGRYQPRGRGLYGIHPDHPCVNRTDD
jgi:hypothetical protein